MPCELERAAGPARSVVGIARSGHAPQLYDSTLPALTPTPRAVDDPGAYEPALPLHILTHIHHLQAGEIALATPAAALRPGVRV